MSPSEILNYDPARVPSGEKLVELREVVFYAVDNTPVKSLFLPASELTNKTDGEIGRYVLRAFLAHNVDVSWATLDPVRDAGMISEIANILALNWARNLIVHLGCVYMARLERGDGEDSEISLRDDTEESDTAAFDRIIDHLYAKFQPGFARELVKSAELTTHIWRAVLQSIAANTTLLLWEEKGDDHRISKEDFLEYSQKHWKHFFDWQLQGLAENWASKVLQRLNPAGVPFVDLKEMVRGGLDVLLKVSPNDLRRLIGIESKATSEKNAIFAISGDGREIHANLPDGKEIHIKLPEGSELSEFKRDVERQDALIRLLSEQHKAGRRADPNRKRKLREFVALTHKRRSLAEALAEIAKSHSLDNWLSMLENFNSFQEEIRRYEARGHDRAIVIEAAETLYKLQNDIELMRRSRTIWDRATSPLGVAQLIASLELGRRDQNGHTRSTTTLSRWYLEGGGRNWKLTDEDG